MGRIKQVKNFDSKIRDLIAEKGIKAVAEKYGKSTRTINTWAKGQAKPKPEIQQTVSRSWSAQKPKFKTETHVEKLEKRYGQDNKQHTGSILEYMKKLDVEYNLSRHAKAFFLEQHQKGGTVSWTGNSIMPISGVKIIPAMSDPASKNPSGAMAFGLTDEYQVGQKGKFKENVRGVTTQQINKSVYRVKEKKFPRDMNQDEMMKATEKIHMTSKVNKQRMPAIFLGYGDLE